MKKNKRLYKIKINFNFFLKKKKLKNLKNVCISKIIKSKRTSGLFKKKFKMRTTLLKRRSLLFFFLEKKNIKKRYKKKILYNIFRKKKIHSYRILYINLYNKIKSMFAENRKILKFFIKKKNLNRQNRLNKYIINFLNKNSKTLINSFEYKLSNILIKSHFFNNSNDSDFFIKNGYININNCVCTDVNKLINFGDIIKLNTRFNYYFFYRKNLNKSLKMSKKIN
jgi:hypothetical protein